MVKMTIWRCGNVVRHINEVTLRRARLRTWIGDNLWRVYTLPLFIQAHSAWPSLRGWVQWVPEMVSAVSGKKRRLWSYDMMALYKSVLKNCVNRSVFLASNAALEVKGGRSCSAKNSALKQKTYSCVFIFDCVHRNARLKTAL